jgi:hypothetical protein
MSTKSPDHAHRFTIANEDAVRVLLAKLQHPRGSSSVDERRLVRALNDAARRYAGTHAKSRQAFFHGLLTGYAVGLKCR